MDFAKLFPLPLNASSHGHEVDMVIYLIHLLMFVLFFGWGAYFLFVMVRFRKRNNPKASYRSPENHLSTYVETSVALFEVLLLIGFSIPFWAKQVNALPNRADIVTVRVVAEQFVWNIHYPGPDDVFGKTDIKYFKKGSNPLGLDPDDPLGKDDIVTINQLHLPIGRPAVLYLSSKDVIHSFSLPVMRVKQDVLPGVRIPVWFTPTKTGNFEIACAQLCGLGHYRMKGFLNVHSQKDFKNWMEEQATAKTADTEKYDDFWN